MSFLLLIFFSYIIATTLSSPTILSVYPTFDSIGITIGFNTTDDPSSSSKASIWYKQSSNTQYIEGHICTFGYLTETQQLFCNIMTIESGTSYDIEIRFISGPFISTKLIYSTTTKHENESKLSSRTISNTLYVISENTNNTECSLIAPCSIETAISKATNFDEIVCFGGTYYKAGLTLPSGVIIRPFEDDEVIFDGSLQQHSFSWIYDVTNNYWYSDEIILSSLAYGVIANDQRLFPYQCIKVNDCTLSLIDLGLANFSGCYYNVTLNRMYLKFGGAVVDGNLNENTDPNELYFEIAVESTGFYTSDNTYFYGITFKNYGSGKYSKAIYVNGASNVTISNNYFKHCSNAVGVKYQSNNLLVQYNEFIDSKSEMLWESIKATQWMEGGGFVIYASSTSGRGMVFRYNKFDNFFDCMSGGGSTIASGLSHEFDVYGNIFDRCSDDGISFDGQCSNCRVWNNTISRTLSAISMAPLYYGPIFVFRNLIYYLGTGHSNAGYTGYPIKTNSGDSNSGTMYIYHNTVDNTYLPNQNGMQIKNGGSWELLISRNNIYLGTNYGIIIQNSNPIDFDYDCAYSLDRMETRSFYWIDRWKSFEEFQTLHGQEINGMFFMPTFTKLNGKRCYELNGVNDTILIDTGEIIPGINNVNYMGNAPDIGAIEYGMKDYRCILPTFSPTLAPITMNPSNIPTRYPTNHPINDDIINKTEEIDNPEAAISLFVSDISTLLVLLVTVFTII